MNYLISSSDLSCVQIILFWIKFLDETYKLLWTQ